MTTAMVTAVSDVDLVLDARAEVGEGPIWDIQRGELLWIDVVPGLVHRLDVRSGSNNTIEVGQPVGCAQLRVDGGLVLAVRDGFAFLDEESQRFDVIAPVESSQPNTRMNDGVCDPVGRFWAGTMEDDGVRPVGALYCLHADHTVTKVVDGIRLSNGIAWSPDATRMYFVDTRTRRVDVFDFDAGTGVVRHRRPLLHCPDDWGLPDGMTVDADGHLWVAFWGGSAVRRFSPNGALTGVVRLPVSQVTSCAFGGPELADLYITTAAMGLSPSQLADEPGAGGIFVARPGVRGLAEYKYGG